MMFKCMQFMCSFLHRIKHIRTCFCFVFFCISNYAFTFYTSACSNGMHANVQNYKFHSIEKAEALQQLIRSIFQCCWFLLGCDFPFMCGCVAYARQLLSLSLPLRSIHVSFQLTLSLNSSSLSVLHTCTAFSDYCHPGSVALLLSRDK